MKTHVVPLERVAAVVVEEEQQEVHHMEPKALKLAEEEPLLKCLEIQTHPLKMEEVVEEAEEWVQRGLVHIPRLHC